MPRTGENELALPPSLANKFDANIQNLLGTTMTLDVWGESYSLTVSGIYNAGYDDFFISSDLEQQLYLKIPNGTPNYSISFDVVHFNDIVAVSNGLQLRGIEAKTAADEVSALQSTFQRLQQLFLILSVLILVIGAFLATVLLFKLQASRYREVGLLSTLGYGRQQIAEMIRLENLLLAALAAVLGLALLIVSLAVAATLGYPLAFSVG